MGKKGSPKGYRSASLTSDASSGSEHQLKWNEMFQNVDPSKGRRVFGDEYNWEKGFKNGVVKYNASKGFGGGKRHVCFHRKHIRSIAVTFVLMGFFFLLDSLMFSLFDPSFLKSRTVVTKSHQLKVQNDEILVYQ